MRAIDTYQQNILERTKKFSVEIIKISSSLPKNPAGFTLADQLVRAATSIGANLIEAQEAFSRNDFLYKVNISLKEAKETCYWLDLINQSHLVPQYSWQPIIQESEEITRILVAIIKKLKQNNKNS